MADDKPAAHDPMRDVYFFITFLVVVVILWYASGGATRANLQGAFLGGPSWSGSGVQQDQTFQTGSVAPPPQVQY